MHAIRTAPSATRTGLLVVNGVGILIASAFSAQGLRTPDFADREQPSTPLARFWAASSAVRTWSLAAPLLLGIARRRPSADVLVAAGLVQLGDSVLGIRRRDPQMAIAPAIMGVVHLASAYLVRR